MFNSLMGKKAILHRRYHTKAALFFKCLTLCGQQNIDRFVSWAHSVRCLLATFTAKCNTFLHNMCTGMIGFTHEIEGFIECLMTKGLD